MTADLYHTVLKSVCICGLQYFSPHSKKSAAEDKTTKMSELTLILAMSV